VSQRLGIEQFFHRQSACFGIAGATFPKILVALIEMLRKLFDDLRLAGRAQSQLGETRTQVFAPLRHGRLP
jgi:hypothetical protein